ncbi:hypothetical protein QWY93_07455 [Echinicola jeungdonensis]|uniref:Lipoprotein n=1 Tax=Echinicola jeungdonensis TaxID=709343 RepID=A0ABV5J776_9BACT|nr:hypothetical protein [Echinicola jeungdonensis]MDN3669159.1 hypothetical protein [Echinicola jeungdonensis]
MKSEKSKNGLYSHFRLKSSMSFLMALLVFVFSCSESDDGQMQGPEPVMPPETSMAPDMSMFDDEGGEENRVNTIQNWAYAAINVGVYSSILYSHLIVPVRAFKVTINQEAHFNEDAGLWVWEKSFEVPSRGTFSVRLTAEVDGTDVSWTGYVSKSGVFENFVWFDGTSKLNGESGKWNLYESPENPEAWLSNSWEIDREVGNGNTSFTVEKEGNHQGSSITYSIEKGADYDRTVLINDVSNSNLVEVQWNKESKFGRVKSEAKYGDEMYHCWDEQLQDSECP